MVKWSCIHETLEFLRNFVSAKFNKGFTVWKFMTAILFALACLSALAGDVPISGGVSFDAVGKPSMLKIHGEGKQLKGTIKQDGRRITAEVAVRLDDLDTGLKLRNEHMKNKYLEVSEFPDSKFKLDPLILPGNEGDFKDVPFKGVLIIHGVEKRISGVADILISKAVQSVSASFSIKLSEYKIQIPSFAGVTVAEDVQIKVTMKPES